jgi:hypothetical protein
MQRATVVSGNASGSSSAWTRAIRPQTLQQYIVTTLASGATRSTAERAQARPARALATR